MTKAAELAKMGEVLTNSQIGGRRNIIINGSQIVAQRGADNLNITSASGGTFATDRFKFYLSLGGTAQFDLQQVAEAPTGSGFSKSLKVSCDVTDTLTANHYLFVEYNIEGQDVQQLKKGTSSAEKVTLSFWLKSNKTASGQVNLRDHDNTRMISKTYTISASNTWQFVTLTFDGDTTGVITNDNSKGLALEFYLDSGTTYSSGATPTSWEATSASDRNATNFGLVSSTDNYWQITGVQLEVGSVATPFEHRSFGEELALCQRYYLLVANGDLQPIVSGAGYSSSVFYGVYPFPVEMRSLPTLETVTGSSYYRFIRNGTSDFFDELEIELGSSGSSYITTRACEFHVDAGLSHTAGHSGWLRAANSSAYVALTAEL